MGKLNDIINPREPIVRKANNIELPKIKLPEFSGKLTEWRQYVELFDKIIHNNDTIPESIKMQYLKTSIKGEAAKLVAHIAPTAENYKTCKEFLYKRYNNKRELFGKLIDSILNLPKMKNESSEELRKIHDTANESLLSIENLGVTTKNWDPLVTHILVQKLSRDTIKHYEFQLKDTREIQTTREFLTHLEMQFLAIKSSQTNSNFNTASDGPHPSREKSMNFNSSSSIKCQFCSENRAKKFTQKDVQEHNNFVKTKKICVNCFGNHKIADCKSKFFCKICKKKHHTLLHFDTVKVNSANFQINEQNNEEIVEISANIVSNQTRIILATAKVAVENSSGEKVASKTLIDQGSQSSFLSETAIQLLNLPRIKKSFKITGIGESDLYSNSAVKLTIYPRFASEFILETEAIVLNRLTKITKNAAPLSDFDHLKNLFLADSLYNQNGPIDMIIGASEYA